MDGESNSLFCNVYVNMRPYGDGLVEREEYGFSLVIGLKPSIVRVPIER